MDKFDRVREVRDQYENALDEAEKLRAEYHREVLKLHRSGMSLREIAQELGISHQRVHQIVGVSEPSPKKWGRTAGGVAVAVLLLASGFVISALVRDGDGPVAQFVPTARTPSPSERPCTITVTPSSPKAIRRLPAAGSAMARSLAALPGSCHGDATILDPKTGKVIARVHVSTNSRVLSFSYTNNA
jgi:hypothetical protein